MKILGGTLDQNLARAKLDNQILRVATRTFHTVTQGMTRAKLDNHPSFTRFGWSHLMDGV